MKRAKRKRTNEKPNPDASAHFVDLAVQYYVVARFGAMAQLTPVPGNLYHHALEMLLKAHLSKSIPLEDLKEVYGHDLNKIWTAFKNLFPKEKLSHFDSLISKLDEFDLIRYPNRILHKTKGGMLSMIHWNPPGSKVKVGGAGKNMPRFQFTVTDLDRFIVRVFELSSLNPQFFASRLINKTGIDVLEYDNPMKDVWFPAQEAK